MTYPMESGRDAITGCALVLGAGFLWGTVGTARTFAPAEVSPQALGVLRLSVAGGALLMLAALRGDLRSPRRFLCPAMLLATMGMAAYQFFFFSSIAKTGVAVGTIVAKGSPPMFAGLMEWVMQGERPNPEWIYATALAVVGCGLLISAGGGLSVDIPGVFLALGAGAAFAIFSISVKRLVVHVPAYAAIAVVSSLGALFLAPFLWIENLAWLTRPSGYAVVLFLGLVATACPYVLYSQGLKRVNSKTGTTLLLAEPLTAGMLGYFFLGERFSALALFGMALLLAGFVVTSIEAGRARPRKPGSSRLKFSESPHVGAKRKFSPTGRQR